MYNQFVRALPTTVSQRILSTYLKVGAWAAARQREDKFHSAPKLVVLPGMDVKVIPALQDNYMYLIVDNETKEAAVVDPVEPENVLAQLRSKDIKLTKILTTHHHWDHAGGNKKLLKVYPELPVYGGDDRVEGLTTLVEDGDKLFIGNMEVGCLHTPCHTKGHICYVVKPKNEPQAVFTGDTLFIGGCGRFFEGTAEQMYTNLYDKLGTLPNDTKVFCGHEYTNANLKFAHHVDPENKAVVSKLEWSEKMKAERQPTVPSTIGEERETNPFMRVDTGSLQARSSSSDPVKTMAYIRKEKDNFKGENLKVQFVRLSVRVNPSLLSLQKTYAGKRDPSPPPATGPHAQIDARPVHTVESRLPEHQLTKVPYYPKAKARQYRRKGSSSKL